MTVINALKFGDNCGGLVADSQSSTMQRKYDFADKVVALSGKEGNFALLGGTGAADLLYETEVALKKALVGRDYFPIPMVARALADISSSQKREKIDLYLRSTFGIDTARALSGEGVGDHLKGDIKAVLTGQNTDLFGGQYVLVGRDQEGVQIYNVTFAGIPFLSARPYSSAGSGSDESDRVLSDYIRNMKREKRNSIPFLEGMVTLIRATNSSRDTNQGVGGVPTISYFDEKGATVLGEEESILASEIVKVESAGLIRPELLREGLDVLLHKPGSFEEVQAEVFKKSAPEYDKIMRLLRGYK